MAAGYCCQEKQGHARLRPRYTNTSIHPSTPIIRQKNKLILYCIRYCGRFLSTEEVGVLFLLSLNLCVFPVETFGLEAPFTLVLSVSTTLLMARLGCGWSAS